MLGEGESQLCERIRVEVGDGQFKLLLNMGQVTNIDSAGLGAMIRGYTSVKREGASLKLANLSRRVQDILALTKLITIFETYDTEGEAISSFA
ncbi:Anti-sigma B factor antagonist RsbV [Minicystis rosea]|nr:Anti-sigma B factor antagonist RsbV [Minicystis rosea]